MQLPLSTIIALTPALDKLLAVELPIKLAFALARFAHKVRDALMDYERVRNTTIKQLGTPDDKGGYTVAPGNRDTFLSKMDTLLSEKVELPDVVIPLSVLPKTIAGAVLEPLFDLVTDDTAATKETANVPAT